MMRRYINIIGVGMLVFLTACQHDDFFGVPTDMPSASVSDGDYPVRIGYQLFESSKNDTPLTRASIIGGDENPSNFVQTLWMLCFTKEGIYLGYRPASLIGDEQSLDDVYTDGSGHIIGSTNNNCWGRYLFEGAVPARTSRIHFVGNVSENKIPGSDLVGGQENAIIKSARLRVNNTDRTIAYWGFHGEDSPEKLKAWLAVEQLRDSLDIYGNPVRDELGNIIQVVSSYEKREGSIVHLIRDRARLSFGDMFDFTRTTEQTATDIHGNEVVLDENNTTYQIESIDWILSNVASQGYIAPFRNQQGADPFGEYYNPQATPPLAEDRLTPYDRADAARITATDESEMVPAWRASWSPAERQTLSVPLFLFEDENNAQNPPKIILRVVYNDTFKGRRVKYHTLMLLQPNNQPCKIYRNHQYLLSIYGLPWEGLGHTSFADAVASVEYANNRTVMIDERVSDVSDGKYSLTIEGGTFRIYQDPSLVNTTQQIRFHYTPADDHSRGVPGITASNFTVKWRTTPFPSFARPDVTVTNYNSNTGEGTIQFTLGNQINNALGSGAIQLHDENSGLLRFINIYSIDHFSFLDDGQQEINLTRISETGRTVNGIACPTYAMSFRLPAEYPLGLYPVVFRMASTTLNPFAVDDNGVPISNATFGVEMAPTLNGQVLDGEVLTGMSFSYNPTQWNYSITPWNYWYTFTVMTPSVADDHIYTIYFDDIRPLREVSNRPASVGLFLKAKYFGDAVAVESE